MINFHKLLSWFNAAAGDDAKKRKGCDSMTWNGKCVNSKNCFSVQFDHSSHRQYAFQAATLFVIQT